VMVEAGGTGVDESRVVDCIEFGHECCKKIIAAIKQLQSLCGKPKRQFKSGETQIDLWYYWNKKQVFAFAGGRQVGTANWGEFGPEAPAPAAATKTPTKG